MIGVVVVAGVGLFVLLALLGRWRRRTLPADSSRWTVRSIVAGAVVVESAMVLWAAPTVLRAAGVDRLGATCDCGTGGRSAGWIAAGAALLVPLPAGAAVAAGRRAEHRTATTAEGASPDGVASRPVAACDDAAHR